MYICWDVKDMFVYACISRSLFILFLNFYLFVYVDPEKKPSFDLIWFDLIWFDLNEYMTGSAAARIVTMSWNLAGNSRAFVYHFE